jgi:hypothetical protein
MAGDVPSVSGALACGLRTALAEVVGPARVLTALERVEPDDRSQWEAATPVGWVPIHVLEHVFGEVAHDLGRNISDLHVEVARISIERTMRTLWRMLLRLTTDNALVSRTPLIFAKSYNRGRLEARITGPGRAEIVLLEWSDAPEWPLRATRIGIETVLTIAGRKDARVHYTRTASGAEYTASWR